MIVDGFEIRQEFDTQDIGPHMDISIYRDGQFVFHTSVEGFRELREKEIRELLRMMDMFESIRTA